MPDDSIVERWKHEEVFNEGFIAVPTSLLQLYPQLKPYPLTQGELLFILELMVFKWTSAAPYPSYQRIAERMGVSDKMARRYAQSLEAKKYLRRERRLNCTNRFDLTGFFDALLEAAKRAKRENVKMNQGENNPK